LVSFVSGTKDIGCEFSYRDWGCDCDHVPFLDEELSRFMAELPHLRLGYRSTCSELRDCPGKAELASDHLGVV
jgi:hypothetical protein